MPADRHLGPRTDIPDAFPYRYQSSNDVLPAHFPAYSSTRRRLGVSGWRPPRPAVTMFDQIIISDRLEAAFSALNGRMRIELGGGPGAHPRPRFAADVTGGSGMVEKRPQVRVLLAADLVGTWQRVPTRFADKVEMTGHASRLF
jgi:hypothetical protein